jgi:hypothetical protein
MYDIFISHKKEQLSWALRLQNTLEMFGYSVFVDHATHNNLQAEQDWEAQLQYHCTSAKHMVLLWSEEVSQGSFVNLEIKWRIQEYHQNPTKRITVLRLDESAFSQDLNEHYGKRQTFRDFITIYRDVASDDLPNYKNLRDIGADDVDYFSWHNAAIRFVEETFSDVPFSVIKIPYIVLAMTKIQAQELVEGKNLAVDQQICERVLNVAKGSFDVNRYGLTPEDWKPFPPMPQLGWEGHTLRQILVACEKDKRDYVQKNSTLINRDEYDLNRVLVSYTGLFSGDFNQRKTAIENLENGPCLVFIDPISMMHKQVRYTYQAVSEELGNKFTLSMSPFIPALHNDFSDYVNNERTLLDALGLNTPYERFHKFFLDYPKTSIMNVDHGFELARWIQFATDNITRYLSKNQLNNQWRNNSKLRLGTTSVPTFS